MAFQVPTLLEQVARFVTLHNVQYNFEDLPVTLHSYLQTSQCCVNPQCQGVYFDSKVAHVKFVDFCGKYRIPLLQYLCSAKCQNYDEKVVEADAADRVKKVLLG